MQGSAEVGHEVTDVATALSVRLALFAFADEGHAGFVGLALALCVF